MPMEGDDYEFFRDVRVPNVTLREKSFLQRSESDSEHLSGVQQWKAALKQLGSFYFLLWACLNRNVKLPYLEPQLGFSLISLLSTVISLFYFLFSCS